jgi:hypothetical protein
MAEATRIPADNGNDYSGDDTGDPVSSPTPAASETAVRDDAALTAKFAEVFGESDEEVAAKPLPPTAAQKALRDARQKLAKREQAEELEEEGLTSVDEPDGVEPGKKAVVSADDEEGQEDEAADSTDTGTEAPVESAIDPFHKWAAQQTGWTAEQITKLEKADPELAAQTLKNVADSYTALSRQALGNVAPGQITGTPAAPNQPAPTDAFPTPKLDKIIAGLKEFSENNGEDLANFVKALNEEIVTPYKASLAAQKVAEQAAQTAEADTAFAEVAKTFPDFFGKDNARNPIQQERVQALAQLANQIRSGARAQGKTVSVTNCIKQAVAVLTADLRATTARKEVVALVKKRSATITAPPNGRRNPATVGGKSKQAAAAAYEAKAAEVGFDLGDFI